MSKVCVTLFCRHYIEKHFVITPAMTLGSSSTHWARNNLFLALF